MDFLESLPARANENASLVRRGRWVSLSFLVGVGDDDFIVRIDEGRVTAIVPRTLATERGVFAVRAASATWREHWRAVPKRDYHDLWSMLPKGLARLDGDLLPLMQNLQYFKDVLASPRPLLPAVED